MKALAEYLLDRGWMISGSDADPEPQLRSVIEKRGARVTVGHVAQSIPAGTELVIFSPAITAQNVERRQAEEQGIPCLSSIQVLARLTANSTAIAVSGTHGKSSTTAILGTILEHAGRSPSVICGAESPDRHRNGQAGAGPLLVVEACEFRRHFLELRPQVACVLGIESDHVDCYPTLDSAIDAYTDFLKRVPPTGTIIYRHDCEATQQAVRQISDSRKISFSVDSESADWQGIRLTPTETGTRFQIRSGKDLSREIHLSAPGRHNVLNAVAAAACAGTQGMSLAEIADGLEAYSGLKRRLEFKRNWHNSLIFDDYAHHPTEIIAALSTLRQQFPQRRLIVVFQSHQNSRTAAFLTEFAEALNLADKVYILPVFAAREIPGNGHLEIAKNLQRKLTVPSGWIPTLDQVWGTLQTDAGDSAVILTMGAGNLTRVHHDSID